MISSSDKDVSVHMIANQSFLLDRLRTQTILAGIDGSSLVPLPTFTSTERRYLERPQRFLFLEYICFMLRRLLSYS